MELNWGILSTANIANKFLATVRKLPNQKVVAVGSRSLEKAKDWAEKNQIPKFFATYDEVIADKEVNAIYIPLPTSYHHEYTLKAAKAGKHVICEKPFARSIQESREMAEISRKNHVLLMDGTMFVHGQRTQKIQKEFLEDTKAIGEVTKVTVKVSFFLTDQSNIRLNPDLEPQGCLGDLGWYAARAILIGFQGQNAKGVMAIGSHDTPPTTTNEIGGGGVGGGGVGGGGGRGGVGGSGGGSSPSSSPSIKGKKGVPVNCTAMFWFDEERRKIATLDCSFSVARQQYWEMSGTEGTIRVENFINARDGGINFTLFDQFMNSKTIEVEKCEHEVEMLKTFYEIISDAPNSIYTTERKEKLKEEFREISVKNQLLLDAIVKSMEVGGPINLADL
eukprot:TRINITY_DN3629_c0_g1_i1.p1 TRINITY_DN3629_c0_g1~~TRINITY_DN3629_c0_g1_i1.p1  ORF type:complete len:392 (-),score=120.24 TRINITY_DN3629_c0_g1_i1:89-1264(-)